MNEYIGREQIEGPEEGGIRRFIDEPFLLNRLPH